MKETDNIRAENFHGVVNKKVSPSQGVTAKNC